MSATATATVNGKPRKQLADQLDRLDSLIDCLAEGLNQAVADACREGARAAVREVLLELIANPDLLAAVRPTPVPVATVTSGEPPAPPAPSFWARVKAAARSAGRSVTGAARTLTLAVEGAVVRPVADALKLTGTTRAVVAVGLGVGLTAGAVSLLCPAWVAAVLPAGAGASAVVAAHVGATINRVFARFRPA